jgi:tetratricopeptide (TPR) repeat protein
MQSFSDGVVAVKRTSNLFFLLLIFILALGGLAQAAENWVEVRSPHFVVLTDANEKQSRHVADQFERVRSVFHVLLPKANVDPAIPIVVVALKDKKGFQALEPEAYLGKGRLDLAGYFLHAADKNYILLRLDAQGEHPFATVYHEYTHLLLQNSGVWLPLWLNEGLAEFFQNTEIHDNDAKVGEPSQDDILYLRQNRLVPLTTLLQVDVNSPYYHEENKGSIFYAESWALTDFLEMTDRAAHTQRLTDYLAAVSRNHDSLAAAQQVFGDLNQLQKGLESYVAHNTFQYFTLSTALGVDDSAFKVRPLPLPDAKAVCADVLAYNQRTKDARTLLDTVLRDDPNNVSAHETMGYLEFRAGNLQEARKWYEKAVKLDSQSFLANYYYAAISMQQGSSSNAAEVESSLRTAIKLNPKFAPAYDQLAVFYGMRREKLDEAHTLNLQAIALEPGNITYWLNTANVLMEAGRDTEAIAVLQKAEGLAKTPEELMMVQQHMQSVQQFQVGRNQAMDANRRPAESVASTESMEQESRPLLKRDGQTVAETAPPPAAAAPKYFNEEPHGQKRFAQGTIKDVHCSPPSRIELKVEGTGKGTSLYSNNFYKIAFSATNYAPEGDLNPCTDLEGKKARVQYSETSNSSVDGQIVSVELSK